MPGISAVPFCKNEEDTRTTIKTETKSKIYQGIIVDIKSIVFPENIAIIEISILIKKSKIDFPPNSLDFCKIEYNKTKIIMKLNKGKKSCNNPKSKNVAIIPLSSVLLQPT